MREQTVNGVQVNMFFILPSSNDDIAYQIRSRAIEEYQRALDDFSDPENLPGAPKEYVLRAIALRRGRRQFRDNLMAAYGGRCAFSDCATADVLEAAHITPFAAEGSDHVSNGILLRADFHTLFDLYLIAVDGDFRICVSSRVKDEYYRQYHGKPVRLPQLSSNAPSRKALQAQRKSFVD